MTKLRAATLLIAAFALLLSSRARAQNTLHIPADQPTIQAGINAAANGDTVLVAPGTYYENINFKGKAITVTSSGGAMSTIIDGARKGPAVQFLTGELRSSVLNGFTVQHGGILGGINNSAGGQVDAGILMHGSAPSILNNIIQQNYCYGIDAEESSPLIQNNEVSGTIPEAGMWCDYVAIGAGILIDAAYGEAGEIGGGYGSGPFVPTIFPTILGNTIENNNNSEDASASGGGAIHVLLGYTIIENNIIRNNFSQESGGGIAVSNYNSTYYDTVIILQNIIYGNSSPCGGGGLAFNQSTIAAIGSPYYYVENNTIVDNFDKGTCADALHPNGSQVYLWQDSNRFVFVNNIIAGTSTTQPPLYCETLRQQDPGFHLAIFDHNDFYNPSGPAIGGQCANPIGTFGNVAVDPLFVNRATANFALTSSSPMIDAGNNSAAFLPQSDFAGNPRQQDATAVGYPIVDIGAYEFTGQQDAQSTTITLVPSAYQISTGGSLTLTATVFSANGIPTGSLAFYEDNSPIGSVVINAAGIASISVNTTSPGVHAFIATYSGQGSFTPAVSVKLFVIFGPNSTLLTLTSSLNPADYGQPVTFTITSKSNLGTTPSPISLTDGGTILTTLQPDSNGNAVYTTNSLSVGLHLLAATYAGDSTLPANQANLTQVITLPAGTTYPTLTALTCSPSTIAPNSTSLLTATVTSSNGTPTGSITFTDNGTTLAQPSLTNGVATDTYTALAAGTHTIVATYVPTGSFAASSDTCTETVTGLPTTSILTVSPSTAVYTNPITLTAAVTPTNPPPGIPTGTITFVVDGIPAATQTLSNSSSTLALPKLSGGPHTFSCTYSGDPIYSSSTCNTASATITPAATNFGGYIAPTPVYALQPITIQAILNQSSIAGGNGAPVPGPNNITITYSSAGTAPVGLPFVTDAKGEVNTSLPSGLPPGTYSFTYNFAGTASLQPCTATITVIVLPVATYLDLTSSANPAGAGQSVTFTATISGLVIPTGNITFLDAGTPIGTAPLNSSGVATFTTNKLAVGTHPITATFSATTNYGGSTSPTVQEVILPNTFTIALSPATLSLPPGQQGTATVQLVSIGAFAGPLTLTYGTLPKYATATLTPIMVTLTAGGGAAATFSLKTTALAANSIPTRPGSRPRTLLAFATLLALLPLAFRKRRRLPKILILILAAASLQTLTGCTEQWEVLAHVAAGTYQIPITATDANSNAKTAVLTITVTP